MMWWIGLGVAAYAVSSMIWRELGYSAGVRDTERRWSEAVARKNDEIG